MFKLHTKKSTLNMTKFASLKKVHTKIIMVKTNLELNDLGFFVTQQKHALTCQELYRLVFQSLYDTFLISPRWEIDERVNFRNFRKLFMNKCAVFFLAFWHPIFKREKRNKVTGHMKHAACNNDRQLM